MTIQTSPKTNPFSLKPLAAAVIGLSAVFALVGCGGGGGSHETSASSGGTEDNSAGSGGGGGDGTGTTPVTIGGTIAGLTGRNLTLQLNNGDALPLEKDATSFVFPGALTAGSHYTVSVKSHPNGQACTIASNGGIAGNDITSVTVSCDDWKRSDTLVGTLAGGDLNDAGAADTSTGIAAKFNNPMGAATDSAGNIYIADKDNHKIRMVTPAGVVSTFAGTGAPGDQNGAALNEATFFNPQAVAVDSNNDVYVADTGNCTIRKITNGRVKLFAGTSGTCDRDDLNGTFEHPTSIAIDSRTGSTYIGETFGIRKIDKNLQVTSYAGNINTFTPGHADGNHNIAEFGEVIGGLAVDATGKLYVADTNNHIIRTVSTKRIVTTVAGDALFSGTRDGQGTSAKFHSPTGLFVDSDQNVYVADSANNAIRKMTSTFDVSTIAGMTPTPGNDNGSGVNAQFANPSSIVEDENGNLLVTNVHGLRTVVRAE